MNVLFWQWNAFMQKGMENALKKLNITYRIFHYQLSDWEKDAVFIEKLEKELEQDTFDAVLSVNYCPLVSNICQNHNLRYIAWVYDSPYISGSYPPFIIPATEYIFLTGGRLRSIKSKDIRTFSICLLPRMRRYGTFRITYSRIAVMWRLSDSCISRIIII